MVLLEQLLGHGEEALDALRVEEPPDDEDAIALPVALHMHGAAWRPLALSLWTASCSVSIKKRWL